MAGDRGLALVVIGLMGISLGWIVDVRIPRASANISVIPLVEKGVQTRSTPVESHLLPRHSVLRGLYLNAELKRFTRSNAYMPGGQKLYRSSLTEDNFSPRRVTGGATNGINNDVPLDLSDGDIEAGHVFEFAKPIE